MQRTLLKKWNWFTLKNQNNLIEVIEINPYHIDTKSIYDIAQKINDGAVVGFPTDSTFSVACSLSNKAGIQKILKITNKKEKQSKLSLFCKNIKEVSQFTKPFSNDIFKLMNRCLPGPYTFILNADKVVRKYFDNKKSEIGVRIPNKPVILNLLENLSEPLITTSLYNRDGKYFTDVNNIVNTFTNDIDILIDTGDEFEGETTVFNCVDNQVEVIREGLGSIEV